MKIKITLPAFFIVIMILLTFINFSCRKRDIFPPVTVDSVLNSNIVSRKFFNTRLTYDENIIAIRNNILRQNKQKPFVEKFVKYAGYPVWDKAIIKSGIEPLQNKTAQRASDIGKVIFIPLALDTQHRVMQYWK